ncbi:MAG TPA: peroxiredoxin-like family protein [Candidatus Limnocylindrales bacterium]|nr:peroxiredoxin-like family protein [Candidatus Limnocylindrales bacterium]
MIEATIPRQQPDSGETEAAIREWLEHWATGPTRTRWTELPPQAGDGAPSRTLVDARSGAAVDLSSTWTDQPGLLLFWRHFGCSCGRDRAARLRDEHDAYVAAGARIVLIGQGEPERALVYAAANGIAEDVVLLCDPDERAYRAFGLLEGGPIEVLFDAPDGYLRCEPQLGREMSDARRAAGRPNVDNPWLLPGEFVVGTDGRIVSAYRFGYCEHWIDPRVNVAAIRFATGELRATFG